MATVTNLTGSNPGPNSANVPDTTQMSVGNVQKLFRAALPATFVPIANSAGPSIQVYTLAATGVGLLATDAITVEYTGTQTANVAVLDARVSAADQIEVKFLAVAGTPTPAASTVAVPYIVNVTRVQPLWSQPTGSTTQITF